MFLLYKTMSPKSVAIYDPRDFIWTKSPCPKDVLCQISMLSGQWLMRRIFLKIYQYFPYWAPKGVNKSDPQACFPPSLVEIGQVVHEKKFLLYKTMSPQGVAICDPREFIWTYSDLLAPNMSHAKYQRIPVSGLWEEDFLRFINIFLIGPQKGASPFIWTNLNPYPPQVLFPPSLVKICQVVHEKKIFKGFCYISLYKNTWPFVTPESIFEQNWISLSQGCPMPNINAFWPVVRQKKIYQHFPYWTPKEVSPFIWTNMNPHPPCMFPTKFGWNWLSSSWEDFLKFLLYKIMSP